MLLSWGRELQFVCLACLPIPDINAYPFFHIYILSFYGVHMCGGIQLTGAQISMSTTCDLGVKLSCRSWCWQAPLSTGSSCQASTWCFNKNSAFPSNCLGLGKLTSWTWHPLRAVWVSRQIRALPMILQTGTKWWSFVVVFFSPNSQC